MTLKRTPDAILRFGPTTEFRSARHVLLSIVKQTHCALVVDLPIERVREQDSPCDPLIMAQPDPEIPGEALMSVIERHTIPVLCRIIDMDQLLIDAVTIRLPIPPHITHLVACYEIPTHRPYPTPVLHYFRDMDGITFAIRTPIDRPYQPCYVSAPTGPRALRPPEQFRVDNIPAPEQPPIMEGDFMRRVLDGTADVSQVDVYIAAFRNLPAKPPGTIAAWLGLDIHEYRAFVKHERALRDIVAARRKATQDQKPTITVTETELTFDPPFRNPVQIVTTLAEVEAVMGQPLKDSALCCRPGDFMNDVLSGIATVDAVNAYVAKWHTHPEPRCTLAEWLGLADHEYAAFVKTERALEEIIAKRRNQQPADGTKS